MRAEENTTMARTKGSKNKPKNGTAPQQQSVAQQPPSAGHNSELSPEARRKLYLQGLGRIEGLQEEMGTINSQIRNERKELKAIGFETAEVNFGLKLRKNKPEDEVDVWRKLQFVAEMLNHQIWTQPDMLDGVDRTPAVDKAAEDGLMAGMEGQQCKPPYAPGSEQEQKWVAQWHRGQEIKIEKGIKPLEQPAPASQSFDNDILNEGAGAGEEPPRQGAAAFRENVAAGDQHIKDTAAALAKEKGEAETAH